MAKTPAAAAASWHADPNNPDQMRWWDGSDWSDNVRGTAGYYAEKQSILLQQIAHDVKSMREILVGFAAIVLIGFIASVLIIVNSSATP